MHDVTRAVDGSSHFRDRWGCIPGPVILEGTGSGPRMCHLGQAEDMQNLVCRYAKRVGKVT